jgi:hypothetical protein
MIALYAVAYRVEGRIGKAAGDRRLLSDNCKSRQHCRSSNGQHLLQLQDRRRYHGRAGNVGDRGMQGAGFDYIIVGAGSAGCTLAHRLTEDGNARVLLIEAGGWDRDPWLSIPLAWGRILERRMHDWMYFAEPEATLDGRGRV